ncbi:MAG: site-specific integrase [Acidobacteriota bacterium]|nr:site-specific integrase [Acidobacteriota bacterium]
MAGQIIKRGDKNWLVRIFMGRDEKGKRRYVNKTIHGTKREADKYLSATLTAITTGTFIEASPMTLNDYLAKWLQTAARPRVTERTFEGYKFLHTRYVEQTPLGGMKLSDVRPLNIQRLYAEMQERGLSARTVRYLHAVLTSALKQAVRWNMLARNPCEAVELPRMEQREMQAFSAEEAGRFLAAAAEDAYVTLFTFALATGMRPEEYLALKWSDVDMQKGAATVVRTLIWRKGGGWYFGEPKTARSRRTVPFPASVLRALVSHKRRQAEERMKAGADYQTHDFVFASREGSPLMPRNILRRHFKPTLKRAKLSESFRLYDLRHSCATLLLAANEHPKVVSERLGHASIILTLDTYSHVLPSMQQAASEKLEGILFKQTGTQ